MFGLHFTERQEHFVERIHKLTVFTSLEISTLFIILTSKNQFREFLHYLNVFLE